MLSSELKTNIDVRYDQTYSGYFDDPEYNIIVNNALEMVVNSAYGEDKDTKKDLLYNLRVFVSSTAVTNADYITMPSDFKFAESLELQYTQTATTTYPFRQATLRELGKEFGYYDNARAKKPEYNLLSVGTAKRIYIYPSNATLYTLIYYRQPNPIDVTTNAPIDLTDTLVEKLIDQCIILFDTAVYNKENYPQNKDILKSY